MVGFVAPQTTFIANSSETNTQTLADYLPGGFLFQAKNIEGSNLRNLLSAFSQELTRVEQKLQEIADEHYVADTFNLLAEWERFVGIPDECFKVENQTVEFRRKQVIAKLALMNVTTNSDFVVLAAFFDVNIEILSEEFITTAFPYTFPLQLACTLKSCKFTMVVNFLDIEKPSNIFPLTFPVVFEGDNLVDFILCIFEKIKPANVAIKGKFKS